MTHTLYWFCVLMYIMGNALCLFWITIPALKEKCRIANKTFTWKEWWGCDRHLVYGNLIFGAALVVGLDEIVNWKPAAIYYLKWVFFLVGAFGTQIAQEKWGQFKKVISKLIDVKTNLADSITGGTTTVQETIEKAKETTGMDINVTPK